MKNLHTPNLTWIGSWWPKIWPHEYLISPIEISVNWPVHNCLEPGQFTLISMGLRRYSCGHISGPHEPIPTKFGLWMFFIMLHRGMVSKMLKCKKKKVFVTSSLLYSIQADPIRVSQPRSRSTCTRNMKTRKKAGSLKTTFNSSPPSSFTFIWLFLIIQEFSNVNCVRSVCKVIENFFFLKSRRLWQDFKTQIIDTCPQTSGYRATQWIFPPAKWSESWLPRGGYWVYTWRLMERDHVHPVFEQARTYRLRDNHVPTPVLQKSPCVTFRGTATREGVSAVLWDYAIAVRKCCNFNKGPSHVSPYQSAWI